MPRSRSFFTKSSASPFLNCPTERTDEHVPPIGKIVGLDMVGLNCHARKHQCAVICPRLTMANNRLRSVRADQVPAHLPPLAQQGVEHPWRQAILEILSPLPLSGPFLFGNR